MKYKLLALGVALLMFAAILTAANINNGLLPRHIQHEEARDDNGMQQPGVLPVVCIETENGRLPHIINSGVDPEGYSIRHSTSVPALVTVYAGDGEGGYDPDSPLLLNQATLRFRGHSSLRYNKKQYKICFVDEQGFEDKTVPFLGMEPHDEWALNAPYLDRSLLRNYLCFNVAGQIMEYTPDARYCELYLNGEYQGLYLGLETVSKGEGRVDIQTFDSGNNALAYIVRQDWRSDEYATVDNLASYAMITAASSGMEVIYPGRDKLEPAYLESISLDISKFEKALYSYDYDSVTLGYRDHIEVDSFVDYLIINEFFLNIDAGRFSTFFYKDAKGGLNIGPVWDFDSALVGDVEGDFSSIRFIMRNKLYYTMLMKDEAFVEQVIARYRQLRKSVLSEQYLMAFIDDTEIFLGGAIERNEALWAQDMYGEAIPYDIRLQPETRNPKDHEAALEQLRSAIRERGDYLDAYIESLRQYSHESAVKKYNP